MSKTYIYCSRKQRWGDWNIGKLNILLQEKIQDKHKNEQEFSMLFNELDMLFRNRIKPFLDQYQYDENNKNKKKNIKYPLHYISLLNILNELDKQSSMINKDIEWIIQMLDEKKRKISTLVGNM